MIYNLQKVACAWMVVLMSGLGAQLPPKKQVAGVSCSPKKLTALTKSLVEESLAGFDNANGKHLGIWSPGFPELKVHRNSPAQGSKVQCSLFFLAQGLDAVLEDQRSNLNPQDVSLHEKLQETITTVKMLAVCLKTVLTGDCSTKPPPPQMPEHTFERKQWGHTLLKSGGDYLNWLQRELLVHISKTKGWKNVHREFSKKAPHKYLKQRHQL